MKRNHPPLSQTTIDYTDYYTQITDYYTNMTSASLQVCFCVLVAVLKGSVDLYLVSIENRGLKRGDLYLFLKKGGFTNKGGSWTIFLKSGTGMEGRGGALKRGSLEPPYEL